MKVFQIIAIFFLIIFRFNLSMIIRSFFVDFIFFDNEKYLSSSVSLSSVLSYIFSSFVWHHFDISVILRLFCCVQTHYYHETVLHFIYLSLWKIFIQFWTLVLSIIIGFVVLLWKPFVIFIIISLFFVVWLSFGLMKFMRLFLFW